MSLTPAQLAQQCPSCATNGRRGYCAPNACYCGCPECPAFASYVPRRNPVGNVVELPKSLAAQPIRERMGAPGNRTAPAGNRGLTHQSEATERGLAR